MTTYKTGYIPDPEGHRRTNFRLMAGLPTATPGEVDLEPQAPAVFDQGGTGSCTGHATACLLYIGLGVVLGFVPSPAEIYRNGRAIDRDPDVAISAQPLGDDGAMPNQVFRAVNTFGVKALGKRPPDGRYSDADPATVNDEPKLGDIEEESAHVALGDYEIFSTGAARIRDMRTALASGRAIAVAIAGGSLAFQSYSGGVLHGAALAGEPLDHYVCVIGYRTTADGKTEFKIRNSWAADWGMGGNVWIDEAAAQTLGALVVGDTSVKEAA